jgi:putative Holliday junction resolvase
MNRAAVAAAPPRLRPTDTLLCFDLGTRRTGVASGSALLGRGEPLLTIEASGDALFLRIAAVLAEWRPQRLVVGVPRHPDGNEHELTRRAQRFARQLRGRFGLPVDEVDERYSTVEAHARAGGHSIEPDAAAAAVLLEQYLFEHREDPA